MHEIEPTLIRDNNQTTEHKVFDCETGKSTEYKTEITLQEQTYVFERCNNPNVGILHTPIDLIELSNTDKKDFPPAYNEYFPEITKKISGIAGLYIVHRYQLQVKKGEVFQWPNLVKNLIEELNLLTK
jgi:hypothetical protein